MVRKGNWASQAHACLWLLTAGECYIAAPTRTISSGGRPPAHLQQDPAVPWTAEMVMISLKGSETFMHVFCCAFFA